MTTYRCVFIVNGTQYVAASPNGPSEFSSGFWVNNKFKFTKGTDCWMWIPPHKIDFVSKITVDTGGKHGS